MVTVTKPDGVQVYPARARSNEWGRPKAERVGGDCFRRAGKSFLDEERDSRATARRLQFLRPRGPCNHSNSPPIREIDRPIRRHTVLRRADLGQKMGRQEMPRSAVLVFSRAVFRSRGAISERRDPTPGSTLRQRNEKGEEQPRNRGNDAPE